MVAKTHKNIIMVGCKKNTECVQWIKSVLIYAYFSGPLNYNELFD